LFVPMASDPCHRANMECGFPSKLTDYTAIGVPLLILGPAYCSAVRWARQNAGVAEVVEVEEAGKLTEVLNRLADPARRLQLGARALAVGEKYFAHKSALRIFYAALNGELSA